MELDKHKKAFGTIAENYSIYRKGYSHKLYSLFFMLTKEHPIVLDIGCGTGNSTEPLVHKTSHVFGVDHDAAMIAEAERNAEKKGLAITYKVAPAERLPFEDEMFGGAVSGAAFHWFATDEAVREIQRVLQPKAPFVVFWVRDEETPNEDSINADIFKRYAWQVVPQKLWSQDTIKEIFEKNKFENVVTLSIPHIEKFTLDERVGLETTSSAFALLSEEDKGAFIRDITEDLKAKLGARTHFEIREQIKVVYGFKQE